MSRLRSPVIVTIAVFAAVALNLIVFAIGAALGANYRFVSQGEQLTVDLLTLIGFSAVPLAVGLTVAALLSMRWRWVIPAALIIGPVLALGTILIMTVPAGFTTPSLVALAVCHAILVPVMVVALRAIRRRRSR